MVVPDTSAPPVRAAVRAGRRILVLVLVAGTAVAAPSSRGRAPPIVGVAVRPLPGRPQLQHHQRHPDPAVGLHRRRQPDLDLHRRASNSRCTATSAWTPTAGAPPTAPRSSSGTATARPTSSGTSTPTAPSPACSPDCCLDANGRRHRQRHEDHPLGLPRPGTNQQWNSPTTAADTADRRRRRRGPVRHLRLRRHALRRRPQHHARALRRVQRQPLPGPALVRQHDPEHRLS